ncbi:MAG: TonB-dependent receptor [Proteobacteria bacterium]|nr:TonB-dependent receptor [Pseudomonadota bacterium]
MNSIRARSVALAASLVGCMFLLHATPAHADARDDARRAFKTGMQLISDGNHLEGIALLEKAYSLLPHPNVLYNIGFGYADAGMYPEAMSAFEHYLSSDPADGAAVERLMALLEMQAEEATGPAVGATGPDTGTGTPSTGTPSTGTTTIAAGPEVDALLNRLEQLADRLEGKNEVPSAPTDEVIDAGALESKSGDIYDEVVVSASRNSSAPVDAPVATTIITAEEIRLSGATNIPDLLRRVPGMSILTMGAGNANLAMRGFNQRISNKLLVLVDGRSAYLDFLGGTFFRTLSIDIQDVERIEVIRGPNSTLYGANAFGGVVNIITKKEQVDEFGGQIHITAGSGETIMGNARFGGRKGILRYGGSMGYEQTRRFELEYGDRADIIATTDDVELAVRALRANAHVRLTPTPNVSLGLTGGLAYSYDEFMAIGVFRNFWMRGLFSDVRFDAQFGGLGIRAFWNHMNAVADQTWVQNGTPISLATRPTANVIDVEAIYSGRALTGPVSHDLAVGAGYRLKTIDWNFLDEPHVEQHLHGFVEDRVTFVPQFAVVAAFRFDQHPLVGFTPSPRAAILVKPTPGQAIRLSAGTAFRTPTFTESYLDLVIPSGVVTGVGIQSKGSTDLDPENIFSVELGYTFADSDFVAFELEGWYGRTSNLIALGNITSEEAAGPLVDTTFITGDSEFTNAEDVFHGIGGEASVHAFPVDGLDLRAAYSFAYYIDQGLRDAGADDFRDQRHPMHTLFVGASYRSPIGLDVNVDVNVVSAVNIPERSFDTSTGAAIFVDCESDEYAMVSARVGQRLLNDKLEFGVTGFNIGGFFNGGHREHCLATRVGARVLGSATYRF